MSKNKKDVSGEISNLGEPTFEKQMDNYAIKDADSSDPIFSTAYHEFMAKLLKTRDGSIKNELIAEVRKVNAEFSKELISDVSEIIEDQWIRVLNDKLKEFGESLNTKIGTIAIDINDLKTTLQEIEDRVAADEIEIMKLKIIHEIPKSIDERVTKLEMFSKDAKEYISPKWTVVRYSVLTFIVIMLVLIVDDRFPNLIRNIIQMFK